jgi:hypothetical protein
MPLRYCAFAGALLFARLSVAAQYNEFVQGDLPSNGSAPTTLALDAGSNILAAEVSGTDFDMLRVVVPAGQEMDEIIVEFHEHPDPRVFAGLQSGATWTAGVGNEIDPSLMLGWVDFPTDLNSHTGENILDDMGFAPGAIGFSPPLASGEYTLLFQAPTAAVRFALNFSASSTAAGPAGDFNDDLTVNGADLNVWKPAFGANDGADADGDGDSDGKDLLVWQQNFGASAAPPARAVPEPGGAMLAPALAGWGAMRRRRRKLIG